MKMPYSVYVFEGSFDIIEALSTYDLAVDSSPEGGVFISDQTEEVEYLEFLSFDRDVLIITPFMDYFYWEVVTKEQLNALYVDHSFG